MNSSYVYTEGLDNTLVTYYYENLREKIYSIIYYLNKSIDSLEGIDDKILSGYSIDEDKVDNVLIDSIRSELIQRVNFLNQTIIPLLNSKINSLN